MGDELTYLLEAFHKIEKAGGQATLSVSTVGGKTKIKLVTAATPDPPSESTSTSSTPERRHRRRGARARARRNQRAAAHQASLAEAATSVPLEDPPPRRPFQLLPSPPSASGRRRVMSLGRPKMPTFSSLNLDGDPPIPPPSPLISPCLPYLAYLTLPCLDECTIPDDHCEDCYRCAHLCIEHEGCSCDHSFHNPANPNPYVLPENLYKYCTQCALTHSQLLSK